MLAPNQLDLMNAALAKLGYTQVDENWIRSTYPPTLLALPQRDAAPDGELGPPTAGEDVADDHPSAAAFEALDAEIMSRARRALDQCALDQSPQEVRDGRLHHEGPQGCAGLDGGLATGEGDVRNAS